MSIRKLPRELGLVVSCNGTTVVSCNGTTSKGCPKNEKFQTAVIMAGHTRAWLKSQCGWSRGLRKGHKRRDLCPTCTPVERKLVAQQKADRDAEILRRDELKKAKASAVPLPKKPRKKKATLESPELSGGFETGSPSADSAAAATQ